MTSPNSTEPGKTFAMLRQVSESALPRAQKAVLTTLLIYARPSDLSVYHGQDQLAWSCGYTMPTVNAAVHALLAREILRIRKNHHPGYATKYQIDLTHLPTRPAYRPPKPVRQKTGQTSNHLTFDPSTDARQTSNNLRFETSNSLRFEPDQTLNSFASIEKKTIETQEETIFLGDAESAPPPLKKMSPGSRSQGKTTTTLTTSVETLAPDDLPITPALEAWRDTNAPTLDLRRAIKKFLLYARAKGIRNADWSAAFCFYALNGQERPGARSLQRGVDEDRLERFQARLQAEEDAQQAASADPATAEWIYERDATPWHRPCGTRHYERNRCPAMATDTGPPPEHSTHVLRQLEAATSGMSGRLGVLLAAAVASNGNRNGHHPESEDRAHA